jgi:hypothetical protein
MWADARDSRRMLYEEMRNSLYATAESNTTFVGQ